MGGMPNSQNIWNGFKDGDFRVYSGSWAPFYNLHKMYAGLRDAWLYCGNEQAKSLFLQFCNWAIHITSGLSDEQMERMLGNEHGGMNEVLADAYALLMSKSTLTAQSVSPTNGYLLLCRSGKTASTICTPIRKYPKLSALSVYQSCREMRIIMWQVHSSGIS